MGSKTEIVQLKTNQFKITVKHPGEKESVTVYLNQKVDKVGLPIQYFMDVQSVICLEQVCKVIPVRIFWNNLGEYQSYELDKGATLEKYENDLFETEDYTKLHRILMNKNSPFKEVYIDEILTVVDENNENADAVSGATALELDEKDTVPGAALTCYTLWHWAQGDIIEKIKELTGKSLSKKQLQDFLKDDNKAYFYLALNELEFKNEYSDAFVQSIMQRVLKDDSLLKPAFHYFKKLPSKTYFLTLKFIFTNGGKKQKIAVLQSFKSIHYSISKSFLDSLSNQILELSSYQEVSLFIDLMQAKNSGSKKVIENVFKVLKTDFISARRAYWFLKSEKLTPNQQLILNNFYKQNSNKL